MTNNGKYKNKYRIASARWAAWDYGSNAAYFITICVDQRIHAFGNIVRGEMILNPLGQSADDCWYEIPEHFPFVKLGEHIIMPNHMHGIVVIDKPSSVETQNFASLPLPPQPQNHFGPQSQNLASILRGYKIGVTKFARQNNIPFKWQARFHDHVIRNQAEYEPIANYIITNPQKWEDDKFYGTQQTRTRNPKTRHQTLPK